MVVRSSNSADRTALSEVSVTGKDTCMVTPTESSQNHLLDAYRWRDAALATAPGIRRLGAGEVLYEAGATLSHVYFQRRPSSRCCMSWRTALRRRLPWSAMRASSVFPCLWRGVHPQSCGSAKRRQGLSTEIADDERGIRPRGPVLHLLLRYTQALITQMSQTAVCNRHHSLDQQLCRWLLLSLDRLQGNTWS